MLIGFIVNIAVIYIILFLVIGKKVNNNSVALLAMPIGFSIMAGLLHMMMKDYYLIVFFPICVFALRQAFETSIWRSVLASGFWIIWFYLSPRLLAYLMTGRWI
jgi:hypothetical protein